MNFSVQYKPLINEEISVSKTRIRPRNIYKINSYTYKDGKTKTLAGTETALVFVLGISPDKTISCIKISLVKPDIFFRWFKKLFKKGLSESELDSADRLEDLIVLDNKDGKKLFTQFLQNDRIYKIDPSIYRTYIMQNIKSIEEIRFKKEILKQYYK